MKFYSFNGWICLGSRRAALSNWAMKQMLRRGSACWCTILPMSFPCSL